MKYATAFLVAATVVAASPSKRSECTFGTYACTADASGIRVCNIHGVWELVGPCPDGTSCEDLPQNGYELPFCTNSPEPKKEKAKKRDYNWCATPGQYTCQGATAIQVCNTSNSLEKVGNCPKDSHCDYINGLPFCVN